MIKRLFESYSYIFIDAIMIALAYTFSMFFFNNIGVVVDARAIATTVPFIILFKTVVFLLFKVYQMLPKHFGFEDALIISVVSFGSNIVIVIFLTFAPQTFIFRSSYFFIAPVELILILLPRLLYRVVNFYQTTNKWYKAIGKRTLIIGAGQAAELVMKEIFKNKELNYLPVGILDDDLKKAHSRLLGTKILGPISKFKEIIIEYNIQEVVIAINNYPFHKIKALYEAAKDHPVRIQKLSSVSETKNTPQLSQLNIEDLLNREPIVLNNDGIEEIIRNQKVLITGGGGSIGSELVRQVASYHPKKLIIFDIYENNAYDIEMSLKRQFQKDGIPMSFDLHVVIGSVYNHVRVKEVFDKYLPTIVFHAAAYKHVPLMEENYQEAIRTNVMGSYHVMLESHLHKVKRMTIVSTDKAVRSTNIMGATKRLSEKLMQALAKESKTLCSAVRFGNVLNSNGSVIPLFMKQIADGGPINVTHKDITRYFMTIPEAVSLILQSMTYMKGSDIFVLDMGEPVKIYDLAENMIRLSGLTPHEDIEIKIVGLRPGEKLYEELLIDGEFNAKTENSKIFKEEKPFSEIPFTIEDIPNLDTATKEDIKSYLQTKVTSYQPNEN